MGKTNVVVLNSEELTSTMSFDQLSSLVSFIGLFLDDHNGWDKSCDLIIVHKNNQVVRKRFRVLQELLNFAIGVQVCGWLITDEGRTPSLNYLDWLDSDSVGVTYDSRLDGVDFDDEEKPS